MGIWTPSGPSGCDVHHSHQVSPFAAPRGPRPAGFGSRDQDAGGVAVLSLVRSVSTSHSSPPHRARLHSLPIELISRASPMAGGSANPILHDPALLCLTMMDSIGLCHSRLDGIIQPASRQSYAVAR